MHSGLVHNLPHVFGGQQRRYGSYTLVIPVYGFGSHRDILPFAIVSAEMIAGSINDLRNNMA
jgi:hypothetical protein